MNPFLTLCGIIILAIAQQLKSDDCVSHPHLLYKELNCIPEESKSTGCVTSYNCSAVFTDDLKEEKCYFRGKEYPLGTVLEKSILKDPCTPSCECQKSLGVEDGTPYSFLCMHVIDCTFYLDPSCKLTYSHDECCQTGSYCDEDKKEETAARCEYDGKTYLEGEIFYPEKDAPCKKCICQQGFNGTLESPHCEDLTCATEFLFYSLHQIKQFCAPVYYSDSICCPRHFYCPEDSNLTLEIGSDTEDTTPTTQTNYAPKCKFGNLTVEIGHTIPHNDECTECSCIMPPLVTCITNSTCAFPYIDFPPPVPYDTPLITTITPIQ